MPATENKFYNEYCLCNVPPEVQDSKTEIPIKL